MKKWLTALCLVGIFALAGCQLPTTDSSPNDPITVHKHKDDNADGACDECNASVQTTLQFYSINDLHGKFEDTYYNMGVDEMTTYLRNAQTADENTVLLSAGDMWQGSAESNFTKGGIIVDWMNDLGFEAMTMGNHEFDWGEAFIQTNEKAAQFPFLGINVYDKDTNQRVEYCQPSVMIERSGVKIGLIGAIGDCYSSIAEEQVQGVYFKVGNALTDLVKAESVKLRNAGADVIVYTLHDAENSNPSHYDVGLSDGYVDLVFEGHSHTVVNEKDAHGVWHLQAGGDNSVGLSHAKLTVNILTGKIDVHQAGVIRSNTYETLTDDPIVDTLMTKYADQLTQTSQQLGYNEAYRDYDALAAFAARSLFEAGIQRWGEDEKYKGRIVLGGGYLNVRSPYYLPEKDVIYGDIYTLFPFDNRVTLCEVRGNRLLQQFINSNNYYCYYGADGQAIKNNVNYNETYYVVVDTYCANYNFKNMGYLDIVEYYAEEDFFTRDAIALYIQAGGLGKQPQKLNATIAEILAIGETLEDNAETTDKYTVTGTIVTDPTQPYGNYTIEDEHGDQLYIYGTYLADGTRYDKFTVKPVKGDTVTLEGKIKKYVNKSGKVTIEIIDAVWKNSDNSSGETDGKEDGDDPVIETLLSVSLPDEFGGTGISKYNTGNYGSYTVDNYTIEYYRAYKSSTDCLFTLFPYVASPTDGSADGSVYNVSPIFGIKEIAITYKSERGSVLYTGDDRIAQMTAYALPAATSFTTVKFSVDTDNFFKLDSGDGQLTVQALSVNYTGEVVAYHSQKANGGYGYNRLNAVTFKGTLVAGQSSVSVPVSVSFDGGSYTVLQTKTYTYYTLEYVEAHPNVADEAAMLTPKDVAAYYSAFKQFPANYAAKNCTGNKFKTVKATFGDDTRYVSKYDRTDGYAMYVPYTLENTTYYEFDIALDASYWEDGERGVGRVVAWENGWDSEGYDDSPVCVYTDDHYATFQEYMNTGAFGRRFDAERSLVFVRWTPPKTYSAS